MNAYTTVNILDMINVIGEDSVNLILSDFSCPKNGEIENYIKKNVVDFAKRIRYTIFRKNKTVV